MGDQAHCWKSSAFFQSLKVATKEILKYPSVWYIFESDTYPTQIHTRSVPWVDCCTSLGYLSHALLVIHVVDYKELCVWLMCLSFLWKILVTCFVFLYFVVFFHILYINLFNKGWINCLTYCIAMGICLMEAYPIIRKLNALLLGTNIKIREFYFYVDSSTKILWTVVFYFFAASY